MLNRIRLSLILCVTLVLNLPAAAQQVGSSTPESTETAAEYYEKALIANNLGETRTAYIYLKNALKEDPLLLPAHLLLGRIYLSLGQGEQAEKQLLIADGLGAHRSLIQNSMARAYLMQGKPEQLLDELFPIGSAPEEDAELLALRGEAHLQLEQLFDAQRSFTQAWESNPRSAAAIVGRVHVMLLQGELDIASSLAREAVEIAPQNPRAWYLKGMLADNTEDYIGALEDYEQAAKLLPSYLPAQIARITLLLRLQRARDAVAVVDEISELFPNDPRTHYVDAVVQAELGNDEAAEEALTEAYNLIKRFPRELIENHMPTLLMAGMVTFNLKQWEQAQNYLNLYLSSKPNETGPRVLLARIELEQHGQPEKAIRLLEPAVERTPENVQALSILAEAYMKANQHLKAAQLLREAGKKRKNDLVLRTQRAVNEFGLGRHSAAIEQLASVLSVRPDFSNAGATLVVMLLQQGDANAAQERARNLMLNMPDNLSYINLFGATALSAGNLDLAQWAFDLALAIDPTFYVARENLAELLIQQNQIPLARGQLERILDARSDEIDALMLLARSYESEGDLERALRLSERALGADPSAVDVAIYQTELLLRMREPDKAVQVAESIEVRAQNPDNAQMLATLSRAYIASGRRATAQTVLRRSSSLAGYDARTLLDIAMLQREAGDLDGALWSLQKATDGEPDFLPTRLKFGELLIQAGRIADAIPAAQALAVDFPEQPYADHLMGLIHQHQGEHIQAFESFANGLDKRASPILALRAYEAKRDAEGLAAAVAFLALWAADSPPDSIVMQALAEGYYALGEHEQALKLFDQALAKAPENPMLLNNLAVIYNETNDERALAYARKAYDLLPSAPEIADTLGWILVRQGNTTEGLKYLRDARSRAASDPGISYHIAVALNQIGRTEEAIEELIKLLQNSVDKQFAERQEASELLDRLRAVRSAQSS
ncbi:MAG: PEP-CTERM system TPR-repeat protein PrsT [Thiohalocapsa sp. PB-PSB1]|nr:MAG: PEP-CTERM system TPR-repeat protein PrsT [Thiohalocapsa sp. PB-PSB1]